MTENKKTVAIIIGVLTCPLILILLNVQFRHLDNLIVALAYPALAAVYFLPSIVAKQRRHSNMLGLALLNLFGGWTVLGWVAALVWAVLKKEKADPGSIV